MIVFNHIPRTGGNFLAEVLRRAGIAAGPRVHFDRSWPAPQILCDATCRPRVMVYHCSGTEFEKVYRREPSDRVFTFLRNRTDMYYSNYAYMHARIQRGDIPKDWPAAAIAQFSGSLEDHVDRVLAAPVVKREFPSSLDSYDLVGITERMDESLAALAQLIGVPLANGDPINSFPIAKRHRRAELEARFQDQQQLYDQADRHLSARSA